MKSLWPFICINMNVESLNLFFLLAAPFFFAFTIEALVIYFFKIKLFWISLAIAFLINLVSITLIYFIASFLLSKIGYELNGLDLPLRVVLFLCWFSIIAEGFMLQVVAKEHDKKRIFLASILMNTLSYLFLYFFIENSH